MYIVIIGLGEVGRHLLSTLEEEGHDIVAIDASNEAVDYVNGHHDVMTLVGYGASEEILTRAQVHRADLLVAVTDNDEVNLIAALAGKQLGAKRTIARTGGNEWASAQQGVRYGLLGVDVTLNPSVLVAQELVKIARSHGAVEVIDLAQDRIELVQIEITEAARFSHRPISSIPLPRDTLIAAVVRKGELFIPGGADVLMPGDHIYLLGKAMDITDAEDLFTSSKEARRACIVGGGLTGEMVARALTEFGSEVLVLETNKQRAEQLKAELDKVTVLQVDGTDTRLLEEEDVGSFDLFAAVTSDSELNLMAALLARRIGATRTAALVHRSDYLPIYKQLGIDIVVSPRAVASDHILRFCRDQQVTSLSSLQGGQGEVLEVVAQAKSRIVDCPLRELSLPRGALIGAIVHNDEVRIARGDDQVHVGDNVIVLTTRFARSAVERLFRPGLL